MEQPEFKEWPKIHRLNRRILITEKIDGTNGLICITESGKVYAGSRSRWITPQSDNHGFAKWVEEHRHELLRLGQGFHYGEWWGNGIQRGYGLPKGVRCFSLFNVSRWSDACGKDVMFRPECCNVVPILYDGPFQQVAITGSLDELKLNGSHAAPFLDPEGIVIFHTASGSSFKVTLENDEKGKTE